MQMPSYHTVSISGRRVIFHQMTMTCRNHRGLAEHDTTAISDNLDIVLLRSGDLHVQPDESRRKEQQNQDNRASSTMNSLDTFQSAKTKEMNRQDIPIRRTASAWVSISASLLR